MSTKTDEGWEQYHVPMPLGTNHSKNEMQNDFCSELIKRYRSWGVG